MAAKRMPLPQIEAFLGRIAAWLQRHPKANMWFQVFRLGLFQFGMGLSLAPITGTLNRVLIDEMSIPAVAVGFLLSIHYFVSPMRTIIGYRSDQARSVGKWRTPYLVVGAMLTYAGLSTSPFTLILLSGQGHITFWPALLFCAIIFLAYGIGVNIVETIYLALVSDITPPEDRGRVLAVLWMMLVMGTVISSIAMGQFLVVFSFMRLIQAMQTSAVIFVALTYIALFNQERLRPDGKIDAPELEIKVRMSLGDSLRMLVNQRVLLLLFVLLFIATLGFSTHDVLLEPYGGQVLGMNVTQTTQLTALWGVAMLAAIGVAGWLLWRGRSAVLLIGLGALCGCLGFLTISYASKDAIVPIFRGGVALIGLGRGLFIVGSVSLIMSLADMAHAGLFMGLWGMMQAIAQGFGTIGGGLVRDIVQQQTGNVALGYTVVYSSSTVLLISGLLLLLFMRSVGMFREGTIRSPWAGLANVPTDQIVF